MKSLGLKSSLGDKQIKIRLNGDFIIQIFNPPIDKFNPIVRLRGIILTFQKAIMDHYEDFLHYVNISQTWWRLKGGLVFGTFVIY